MFITGTMVNINKGNEINIDKRRSKRTPIQKARVMSAELASAAVFLKI
jgi:hypothetical protein